MTHRTVGSRIGAAIAACVVLCTPVHGEQRTSTAEDDIKAAFLYNFTKFIEWPAQALGGTFRVCSVAEPEFNDGLDRTLAGESVGGRPIERITPASPEEAAACQILFLSRREDGRAARWISAVSDRPVLVVGESRGVWDRGAQITFLVESNRVQFDVNQEAAARAGLAVSSKLLRVAHNIARRGPG